MLPAPACAFMLGSRLYLSPRGGTRPEAVPPRTHARHDLVIAVHHLHGAAEAVLGILQPQRARLGAVFLRKPDAVMAPHARTFLALGRLPRRDVDRARAPAVLDHEG